MVRKQQASQPNPAKSDKSKSFICEIDRYQRVKRDDIDLHPAARLDDCASATAATATCCMAGCALGAHCVQHKVTQNAVELRRVSLVDVVGQTLDLHYC